jgi:hypothetical protein
MPRKTITITISEGRDQGKRFKITEWAAWRAEQWAMRVLLGLGKGGVELPPEVLKLGAPAIVYVAASQIMRIPSRVALRLADELMECVERVEEKVTRSLVPEDIEEVATRLKLKAEVVRLTYGFFVPAAPPTSAPESGTGASSL